MQAVLVRRASPADIGALLPLYEELADGKRTAAPADRLRAQAVLAEVLADPRRHLLVAVLEGELVGTADRLVVANLTHRGEPWAIVENVVVAASHRHRGVGRALMGDLIEIARAAGCYKVQLLAGKHRARAHVFYRTMGMEPIAEGFKLLFDE
jgi:GNAT superfamily N-acetyltransferase